MSAPFRDRRSLFAAAKDRIPPLAAPRAFQFLHCLPNGVLSQPPRWSQRGPNLRRGLGTRKTVVFQRCPQPYPVVPTFFYTFMREKEKGREHVSYTKRVGTPLGTPRLGPLSGKPLIYNDNKRSQPPKRLGRCAWRLGQAASGVFSAQVMVAVPILLWARCMG